jgi:putative two-component system response regulator
MIADAVVKASKVLIVDDEEANVQLLERLLRGEGYARIASTTDPRQALPAFQKFQPDLLLLDLMMPHLDGYAVMKQLKPRIPPGGFFPILVITADVSTPTKHRTLADGATDFLTKPIDAAEVVLRVHNLLETRCLYHRLEGENERLEVKVRDRTQELENTQLEVLARLALAAEYRDDNTGEHTRRVGHMSALLAEALGLPRTQVTLIRQAAPLHDVGKIGISDAILLKPGKLTPEESDIIKNHVGIGAKMLHGGLYALVQMAETIALTHHERWDGMGYHGLKGENIPLPGRIVTVADVFDALTHARPYKKAWPIAQAREEIARQSGRQFDPHVADAFIAILDREGENMLTLDGVLSASKEETPWNPSAPDVATRSLTLSSTG